MSLLGDIGLKIHKNAVLFSTPARGLKIISKSVLRKGGHAEEDLGTKAFWAAIPAYIYWDTQPVSSLKQGPYFSHNVPTDKA